MDWVGHGRALRQSANLQVKERSTSTQLRHPYKICRVPSANRLIVPRPAVIVNHIGIFDNAVVFIVHFLIAIGKSGTVSGLTVAGVCLPPVNSLTRSAT
jgi:hypothetical protein